MNLSDEKTQLAGTPDTRSENSSVCGIEITDLTVRFGDGTEVTKDVLDSLTLSVCPGEVLALLGPSGCGKSTLLRVIAGLIDRFSGSVEFVSESGSPVELKRAGDLSFVFQEATLLPWRTVQDNIGLPMELGRASGVTPEIRKERIQQCLQDVDLPPSSWGNLPRELSGGMKMRASIARALVTDPSLLLLDEPFAALDEILRYRLNDLLVSLWSQRRRTILFVTHSITEAIFLSHRIAIIGNGQIASVLANPLPWPRERNARTSPEFAQLAAEASKILGEVTP